MKLTCSKIKQNYLNFFTRINISNNDSYIKYIFMYIGIYSLLRFGKVSTSKVLAMSYKSNLNVPTITFSFSYVFGTLKKLPRTLKNI